MFRLYANDLSRGRLRETESTDMVLASWMQREAPYEHEVISSRADKRAAKAYFSITAERIFFRKQILSDCNVPAEFLRDARQMKTCPFGAGTASLQELLQEDVRAAMTYVPLIPEIGGARRKPIMARLYCVSGLRSEQAHPFIERGPVGAENFSWFLAGVDTQERTSGRSWFLAASTLMKCMERGNLKEVRRKLASKFVFSGDVEKAGVVGKVILDGKLSLAAVPEYEKLTWIVPHIQKDDVSGIKSLAVRSVDRAYERVLNGMDRATRSLFDHVKDGTPADRLTNIYRLLQDNADANIPNEDGWCVRQIIMSNIMRKIVELIRQPGLAQKPTLDIQNAIMVMLGPEWDAEKASAYYGNDPLLFFLAARAKNRRVMQFLKATMNINGVDRDGETALDFALDVGDSEAADFLREFGADKRGKYGINSKHVRAFLRDPVGEPERDRDFFREAFAHGLDPFSQVTFGRERDEEGHLRNVKIVRRCWDNLMELEQVAPDPWNSEPWVEIFYEHTSVFMESILKGNWAIVKMCLGSVNSPLKPISVRVADTGRHITSYIELAERFSSPLVVRAMRDYLTRI